ncbi:MAG: HD domain-containing protein [Planctomycetota bacterium]|nr:MAG: HD domain-containing protein [Planctomycetota bacterium]
MEQRRLYQFKAWFDDYVAGFYGDDEFVNANVKLKEEHSRRTCDEMRYLSDELGLTDNQKRIADAIALLHDIGRFEQFVKYRTYHDPRSVNHCLLCVEVLRQTRVLEGLERKERQLIKKAIEYHGRTKLPDNLDGQCLLFSKLLRDADKLDIFYVVTEYYKQYRDNPEQFKLELELPDEPRYSADVVEDVLCGRRIDYHRLQTMNDMKLCQLAWMYDVNFVPTLKRIRQRRLLEKMFDFLPETNDIDRVRERIFQYVDSRIKQDG